MQGLLRMWGKVWNSVDVVLDITVPFIGPQPVVRVLYFNTKIVLSTLDYKF